MTPSLANLTARYLARAAACVDAVREVEPYEVVGGFRAAPADLWREAFAATATRPSAPAEDWAAFCAQESSVAAVPFAAGLFPQMVCTIPSMAQLCRATRPVHGFERLKSWAMAQITPASLAVGAGILANLGDPAAANQLLQKLEQVDGRSPLWWNQSGACLWLAGDGAAAHQHWSQPIGDVAAEFNCGLALLASGQSSAATTMLASAAQRIPDSAGWSHLARLYLELARQN